MPTTPESANTIPDDTGAPNTTLPNDTGAPNSTTLAGSTITDPTTGSASDAPTDPQVTVSPGCSLWLVWVLASALGLAVGWPLGWQLSYWVPGALAGAAIGLGAGLGLGLLQWLALRRRLPGAGWWALLTTLGWALGFGLGVEIAQRLGLSGAGFGLLTGGVLGTVLGLAQSLALRRAAGALWWAPVSALAWSLALVYYQPAALGLGVLYGLLAGMLTGIALVYLLYRPVD